MTYTVEKFSPEEWGPLAKDAHLAVFNEVLPDDDLKIDFALMAAKAEKAIMYVTCREIDIDSVYLKHGGAFDPYRNGITSFGAYRAILDYLRKAYKNITSLAVNTNNRYLRMALNEGFKIIGLRNYKGHVLIELFMEGN